MLNYKNKPLEELNFNECIEFEKELLKKILGASRTGMSDNIIEQLQFFNSLVQEQKKIAMNKELATLSGNNSSPDGVTIDTEIDNDTESESE